MTVTGAGSTWTNSGQLSVGNQGAGSLTVAAGGFVQAVGTLSLAQEAGSSGSLNIGAALGALAAAPGTLSAGSVAFGAGTGTLNFNHTSDGYIFAPSIAGNGAIKVAAGMTILTGDSSAFAGATTVEAGILRVNGQLGGSVAVTSGARLQGMGTIQGTTTINAGGILSPGASPGTLTLGAVALDPNAITEFELGEPNVVGGTLNDLVVVTGELTLDGTANISVSTGGSFGPGYYRLFNYGTLVDNGLEIGTKPTAEPVVVLTNVAGQVNMRVGAASTQIWDGVGLSPDGVIQGGAGNWNTNGTNWTISNGSFNDAWLGASGVFRGAAGVVTVAGTQGFQSLSFETSGYVLQGAGSLGTTGGFSLIEVLAGTDATVNVPIIGTAGLNKTGTGTLIIGGQSTYGGATDIAGGTLRIALGNALPAGTAVAITNNARLDLAGFHQTIGSLAGAAGTTVTLGAGTLSTGGNDGSTTFAGMISGDGALDKLGAGTMILTGINTYTGSTTVTGGTLQLGDGGAIGSIIGDVANAGTLAFNRSDTLSFGGAISGAGAIRQVGTGTTTLTGNNTYTGGTTITAGTLQVGDGGASGSLGGGNVANGGGFVFNRSDAYSYAGAITGSGTLEQAGTGTTNLTGNSGAFTGLTTVSRGMLVVNGTLGGTLNVANAAVLGGSGTVGATTLDSGGLIAPGNSIGTLTVGGDLTFKAGSVYQVEVDPTGTTSDLIVVNGTAFLAGSVAHIGEDGNYKPLSEYKILTASGGFAGTTFAGVSSNYAFLDARLAYGTNDVTLRLGRNDVAFTSVAGTPNQKTTAGGIDSLGFGNPVYDAVVVLDTPAAQHAFDQLSGETHATGITALIGSGGTVRSIVSRRFQSTFAKGQAAASFPLTSYASWGSSAEQAPASGSSAWGQIFGSWGRTSGDRNAAGLRHDDGGFLVGADATVAESWSIGAFAGYSRSTFSLRDRSSAGSSDNFHLGLHAGTEIGALRLNVGAAHTWHSLDTRRTVAFRGFSETLSASYDARTAQIFGEVGYRFGTDALAIEPFAGLAYVHTTTDSFTETGGAAALTAARSTTATTFSTLGLRAFSQFEVSGMQATVRGMVAWRHAFGDNASTTRLTFAGGTGFSVSGTPIAKDAGLFEAGLDLAIRDNVSVGLFYDGQYSRRSQEHGFNARFKVAF